MVYNVFSGYLVCGCTGFDASRHVLYAIDERKYRGVPYIKCGNCDKFIANTRFVLYLFRGLEARTMNFAPDSLKLINRRDTFG